MIVENNNAGWRQIRMQLEQRPRPALVALLKDLYETSAHNRDFLHARFEAGQDVSPVLEKYRRRIVDVFFPRRGQMGKPRLTEARKAIRDYRKSTGNVAGAIELMLTYVESGTKFTLEYGDVDEAFYRSLASVCNEMVAVLLKDGAELYPRFRTRIQQLSHHADRVGWGYGDYLRETVRSIEMECCGE